MRGHNLRVLEIFPFQGWAGTAQHVFNLIQWMHKRGHHIQLITRDLPISEKFEGYCTIHPLALKKDALSIRWIPYVVHLIQQEKIDIIHTHGGKDTWIALLASAIAKRGKVVATRHDKNRKIKKDVLHKWFYSKLAKSICVSQNLQNDFLKENPYISADKAPVIYNGINIDKYTETTLLYERAMALRQSLECDQKNIVLACFGRIHPQKGLDIAIEAMSLLKEKYPFLKLLLIGEEEDVLFANRLKERVELMQLEKQIAFLGFQTHIAEWMNAIDILIFPSVGPESFGLVLCEAMAAAKPVITTVTGAQAEIVEDRVNGFLVQTGSPSDLAGKIEELVADRALRERMGLKGRNKVQERFSIQQMGIETERVFQSCLKE